MASLAGILLRRRPGNVVRGDGKTNDVKEGKLDIGGDIFDVNTGKLAHGEHPIFKRRWK